MHMSRIDMTTTVKRTELLQKLRANLENHAEVVREARNGYVKRAAEALKGRLEELRSGKVVALTFTLSPPADYSRVYQDVIAMLEWNTQEEVTLGAEEFRRLVQDKWDWTEGFFASNLGYSQKAWDWMNESTGGAISVPPPG